MSKKFKPRLFYYSGRCTPFVIICPLCNKKICYSYFKEDTLSDFILEETTYCPAEWCNGRPNPPVLGLGWSVKERVVMALENCIPKNPDNNNVSQV